MLITHKIFTVSDIFRLLLINVTKKLLCQDKKWQLLSFVSEASEI